MNIDYERLCYGCFKEKSTPICPFCGYGEQEEHSPHTLPAGSILGGKYIVGKVLGQGGFGITYLGFDLLLQIKVALKEYIPSGMVGRDTDRATVTLFSLKEKDQYEQGKEKFLDEARILAKLNDTPNIVKVQNFFRENNTAYFVMEYIEGMSLKQALKQQGGRLSFEQTCEILMPIAQALSLVHQQNLLHRDISPDNIFITNTGQSKLLDFGAARFTLGDQKSMSVILKHGFAPEEQYRTHGNQGPWTDIYALGATFYNCLTGACPPDAIERIHQDTLVMPNALGVSIPSYAEHALAKALAVKSENRFYNVTEFISAMMGKSKSSAVSPINALPNSTVPLYSSPNNSVPGNINHTSSASIQKTSILNRIMNDKRWWIGIGAGVIILAAIIILIVLLLGKGSNTGGGGGIGGNTSGKLNTSSTITDSPVSSNIPENSVPPQSMVSSENPPSESPSSSPESSVTSDTNTIKGPGTYTCTPLGFSISLPEGWSVDESVLNDQGSLLLLSDEGNGIEISNAKGENKQMVEDSKDQVMETVATNIGSSNYDILGEDHLTLGGYDYYYLAFGLYDDENVPNSSLHLYVLDGANDDCYYILYFEELSTNASDDINQVIEMVTSFYVPALG